MNSLSLALQNYSILISDGSSLNSWKRFTTTDLNNYFNLNNYMSAYYIYNVNNYIQYQNTTGTLNGFTYYFTSLNCNPSNVSPTNSIYYGFLNRSDGEMSVCACQYTGTGYGLFGFY